MTQSPVGFCSGGGCENLQVIQFETMGIYQGNPEVNDQLLIPFISGFGFVGRQAFRIEDMNGASYLDCGIDKSCSGNI